MANAGEKKESMSRKRWRVDRFLGSRGPGKAQRGGGWHGEAVEKRGTPRLQARLGVEASGFAVDSPLFYVPLQRHTSGM